MENYWVYKEWDLGKIRENSKHKVQFTSLVNIPEIINIKPSCGCTDAKYDIDTGVLNVSYSSGKIPYHIKKNQNFVKTIRVEYKDGTQDYLEIKGIKVR